MFSAKILSFLITSTFFLQCMSQEKHGHLRGTPDVDYPTYYAIPKTSFRCSDQLYNPGFYADTETRCQVFHYCYEHRQESFLCPMGTVFNQPLLACDYWYSSNCSLAPFHYNVNAIKRNEYHFAEADDPLDSQSENVFDKMANLYEINRTPEPAALKNDFVAPENGLLIKEGIESSSEPFAENNNYADNYNKYSYDKQFNMIDEKQPEIVKYNVNTVKVHKDSENVHKGSENEQPYETDNMEDFIFSEDGMLHPSQEDAYQIHPTDMNFDQGYSGYAEIPSEVNFNYDLNEDFDSESDFQIPDFELQKRQSDTNSNYVRRRPSSRKPIIIIPEVEPEIVQLPVTKHKRKPIGIVPTVDMNTDGGSSYETTYDPNIYNEETVSVANEGLDGTASGELPLDEPNSNLNRKFNDPTLLRESPGEITENDSQLYQMDSTSVIYDHSTKKTRNAFVLSNVDEEEMSFDIFGSGSNEILSISNDKHHTLTDSNYDGESEIFTADAEGSLILPSEISDTTVDHGISSDGDAFLGSGSEENIQPHLSDGSSFSEDQIIFSDSEDAEITDMETFYVLPMNLSNTFEEYGISVQKTTDMPNFAEEVNDPTQFVLKYDSEGNPEYIGEASLSSEIFGKFPPSESSENIEGAELVLDGSGGSSEFNDLPHELQESSDNTQDGFDKKELEIRKINGVYYVVSDSEYRPNYEFGDSNGFYSENVDYAATGNFEDISDKASEELIDSEGSQYAPEGSQLRTDYIEESLHSLDYQDSVHLENMYKKLPDEFETETSSHIPEEYIVGDSDTDKQFSAKDIKFLEIMTQTPIPMLKNLFEVSEKLSSGAVNDEIPLTDIIPSEEDIIDQNHGDSANLREVNEFENHFPDTSDAEEHTIDMEASDIQSEILDTEQKIAERASDTDGSDLDEMEAFLPEQEYIVDDSDTAKQFATADNKFLEIMAQTPIPMLQNLFEVSEKSSSGAVKDKIPRTEIISSEDDIIDQNHGDTASLREVNEFENNLPDTSDAEEHTVNIEVSEIHSEILGTEQKIAEGASDTDGSDQDETKAILPEQDFEIFASGKESDPFNTLFVEDNEILDPESKQKLSLKAPIKPKNALLNPVISKDLKKVARGKRLSDNLRTFNPPNRGNPLVAPSTETLREAIFSSIPSEFLKMKHSSLRPYFYNYGLKDSGFNPRAGDVFKSSKLSKLTSIGKRLLAKKRSKFNIMKKYIDSYRNN